MRLTSVAHGVLLMRVVGVVLLEGQALLPLRHSYLRHLRLQHVTRVAVEGAALNVVERMEERGERKE